MSSSSVRSDSVRLPSQASSPHARGQRPSILLKLLPILNGKSESNRDGCTWPVAHCEHEPESREGCQTKHNPVNIEPEIMTIREIQKKISSGYYDHTINTKNKRGNYDTENDGSTDYICIVLSLTTPLITYSKFARTTKSAKHRRRCSYRDPAVNPCYFRTTSGPKLSYEICAL